MSVQLPIHYSPRQNAKSWGNRFTSRFLEPGIVSYEDSGGDKELLKKETIDLFLHTFIGRPTVIRHSKVTPQNMQGKAVGYITRVWFEAADGWFWCEGIIFDDDAKDLIRRGWSVSCSYHVTSTDERGGVYHSIPYKRELLAFDGEHLAIVENPRYEGATIRLNSKPSNNHMNLFKLFKKTVAPDPAKAAVADPKPGETTPPASHDNATDIDGDTEIEINGQRVRINALVEAYTKPAPGAAAATEESISEESTIEVAGKPVAIKDLVARYNAAEKKEHCNEDEEDEPKRKENESEEEFEKRKDASKSKKRKNSQAFRVLSVAATTPQPVLTDRANSADTTAEKIRRGKERYGSAKVDAGKN